MPMDAHFTVCTCLWVFIRNARTGTKGFGKIYQREFENLKDEKRGCMKTEFCETPTFKGKGKGE